MGEEEREKSLPIIVPILQMRKLSPYVARPGDIPRSFEIIIIIINVHAFVCVYAENRHGRVLVCSLEFKSISSDVG